MSGGGPDAGGWRSAYACAAPSDVRDKHYTPFKGPQLPEQPRLEARKLVEQGFGWMKTIGGLRKLRHRGGRLVGWVFTFTAAAYNIMRLRRLLEATA